MDLQLRYPLHAPPERFWEVFFDPDVTTKLHLEALGSTSVEIEALVGTPATGVERTIRYGQIADAPGPVKKLFGAEVVTTESGRFDPDTGIWRFSLTPATMADKIHITGSIEVLKAGDDDEVGGGGGGGDRAPYVQAFSLEARVKIFGIGPVVERFIDKQARDTQAKAVAFLDGILGDHP